MTRWLEAAGADLSRVTLRSLGGGEWCAVARKRIRAGERVLAIPRSCMATGDSVSLVQFVRNERANPISKWSPFLDALPKRFPHHPQLFERRDLAWLDGSYVADEVRAHERPALEYLTVISRSFQIDADGGTTSALIPFADMLHHGDPSETTWAMHDEDFVMTALRSFRPGDAIHDNYGNKSNSELLFTYGFCDPRNRRDEARVSLGGHRFAVMNDLQDDRTSELFAFARKIHLEEPRNTLAPVSLENEAMAIDALAFVAREALARFSTTLADDAKLLDRRLTTNARNAVLARMSEKRALTWLIDFAAQTLPRLRVDRATFLNGPLDPYLTSVAVGISRAR